jgi:hypothetical protein
VTTAFERQVMAQPLVDYSTLTGLVLAMPNRQFNNPPQGTAYVRFTVLDAKTQQIEMGSPGFNTNRTYGSLILQIFWPAGEGDGGALVLADALGKLYVQKIFNFPDLSGLVRMRNPVVKTLGNLDVYYQVNVVIPFHRDDL